MTTKTIAIEVTEEQEVDICDECGLEIEDNGDSYEPKITNNPTLHYHDKCVESISVAENIDVNWTDFEDDYGDQIVAVFPRLEFTCFCVCLVLGPPVAVLLTWPLSGAVAFMTAVFGIAAVIQGNKIAEKSHDVLRRIE